MKSESESLLDTKDLDSNKDNISTVDAVDSLLETALGELDALFSQENPKREKAFKYLLSLWSSFSIYQLDPVLPSEEDESGEGGARGATENFPQVICLKGGWKILDFGNGLITSAGENYAYYSTGPLLKTVNYMINCLIERGAKKVIFSGALPAKRYAWLRCKQTDIKTRFSPSEKDYKCQENIERIQKNNGLSVFSI